MIRDYVHSKDSVGFRVWMITSLGRASDAEVARIWAGRTHRGEVLSDWYREAALAELDRRRGLS